MAFDQNSLIGPASVLSVLYTSPAQQTGDGGPIDGFDLHILIQSVLGNPNGLFRVSCLQPDGVTWQPVAYDPLGPVNTQGQERNIHFSLYPFDATQWRLECVPNSLPNGLGSLNSSSLSGQSFNSSSSGGGPQTIVFLAGLVVSANG
jgi:hypothetical protein